MEETTRAAGRSASGPARKRSSFADWSMTHFGEDVFGVCLAGEYTLRRHFADDGPSAFFEAVRNTGEPLLIKLEPNGPGAEERLALWRRIAYLQHPNLLRMLDCGSGGEAVYAVMEWPDDRLAAALDQAPLAESEARDLMLAALDALRYLHAQGLVHGEVDAHHVYAVGNTIKLSTDNLREPEHGESPYAGDIGALGSLLFRVLAGREFDGTVRDVPEPFATIVRNTAGVEAADCWRIPEILAALVPTLEQPPAAAAAVEDQPVAAPPVEPAIPAAVIVEDRPAAAPPAEPRAAMRMPPRLPAWAWPASLAVVLGCIAWVLYTPARKQTTAPPPAPVYAPAPQDPAPSVLPSKPPESEAARSPQERSVWRVIAYTYNALRDAQKKVLAINRRWPGLNAEVFAPKGEAHPPYLVALGGRMNRMDAARLLQKARSRGLPRDTFILNFSD